MSILEISKNDDNSLFFPGVSNITEVSDKNNIVDKSNELEIFNLQNQQTAKLTQPEPIHKVEVENPEEQIEENDTSNNEERDYQIINIESNHEDDFELSEDYSEVIKYQTDQSSEKDVKTNSNPNDDQDDSIQSISDKQESPDQTNPRLFIKIEEEQSSTPVKTNLRGEVEEETDGLQHATEWSMPTEQSEIIGEEQDQQPTNRFKKLDEEMGRGSYFNDLEYLNESPKEESMFWKNRFQNLGTDEINIQEFNNGEEEIAKLSSKDSYESSLSKEMIQAISQNAKQELEENQSDELDSFKNEHNRIINEENKFHTKQNEAGSIKYKKSQKPFAKM